MNANTQGKIADIALTIFDRWQKEGKAKMQAGRFTMSQWWTFEEAHKIEMQKAYTEILQKRHADIDVELRGRMATREDAHSKKRKKAVRVREPDPTGPVPPVTFTKKDKTEIVVTFPENGRRETRGRPSQEHR